MEKKLITVSSTPHIRSNDTIERIMLDVLIALVPAALAGIIFLGFNSLLTIVLSMSSAVCAEYVYQKLTKQPITIKDFSAAVTGLLLAFNLPPTVPFWLPVIGSFFAIIVVKQIFGGLGQNFMNPALAARAFLLTSFPTQMTNWVTNPDTVSGATVLSEIKDASFTPQASHYFSLLFHKVSGCIGEVSAVALLIGGIYLLIRRVINWRIPVTYIATFFVLSFILGRDGLFTGIPYFEVLSGGLIMGAFFMATDYSSSPITPLGKIIMGVGCGVLTVVIRVYGGYPEGVSYSILIMNLFVPLIDRYTKPRIYGEVKK